VHTVFSTVEPLAKEKKLALRIDLPTVCQLDAVMSVVSHRCY
jgi:hypothetical protein